MTPRLRKLGLLMHIALSVGWLGAVVAFVPLAIASFSKNSELARASYLAMSVVGRGALLPLSVAALVSGVVQSLGTKWRLFQHYWVLVKLVLTLLATVALFLHQATAITDAARLAAGASEDLLHSGQLRQLGVQLLADASLGVLVLLAITIIAVYKPWGLVGHMRRGLRAFLAAVAALVVAFVVLHLSGHSLHRQRH